MENLTGSGQYHWMAGNFLKYGAAEATFGSRNANDLPIDAHQLLALCAPRLAFVSYGVPEKGDALWLDQQGSYMATVAAGPAYRLLGAGDLGVTEDYRTAKMPAVLTGLLDGRLAWRQHDGGHTDGPSWKPFIAWAKGFVERASAARPRARLDQNSWIAHAQLLEKKTQGRIDAYFVGDSITRRWGATDYPALLEHWRRTFTGWNAANFGWGADRIEHMIWRLDHGELDGVNPRVIVILAGTNDIGTEPLTQERETDILGGLAGARGPLPRAGPGRDGRPDQHAAARRQPIGLARHPAASTAAWRDSPTASAHPLSRRRRADARRPRRPPRRADQRRPAPHRGRLPGVGRRAGATAPEDHRPARRHGRSAAADRGPLGRARPEPLRPNGCSRATAARHNRRGGDQRGRGARVVRARQCSPVRWFEAAGGPGGIRVTLSWIEPAADEFALFSFDKDLREEVGFTRDPARILAGLSALTDLGQTSLYDAIARTAATLGDRPSPRRAVVVITDGVDTKQPAHGGRRSRVWRARSTCRSTARRENAASRADGAGPEWVRHPARPELAEVTFSASAVRAAAAIPTRSRPASQTGGER